MVSTVSRNSWPGTSVWRKHRSKISIKLHKQKQIEEICSCYLVLVLRSVCSLGFHLWFSVAALDEQPMEMPFKNLATGDSVFTLWHMTLGLCVLSLLHWKVRAGVKIVFGFALGLTRALLRRTFYRRAGAEGERDKRRKFSKQKKNSSLVQQFPAVSLTTLLADYESLTESDSRKPTRPKSSVIVMSSRSTRGSRRHRLVFFQLISVKEAERRTKLNANELANDDSSLLPEMLQTSSLIQEPSLLEVSCYEQFSCLVCA